VKNRSPVEPHEHVVKSMHIMLYSMDYIYKKQLSKSSVKNFKLPNRACDTVA